MLGNDLQITADFDTGVKNYTESITYDTEPIDVRFKFSKGVDSFKVLHFGGSYAMGKDSRNTLLIFNCSFGGIAEIDCVESASSTSATSNVHIQEDIVEIFGYLFTWGVDPVANVTVLYIFDGDQTIFSHLIGGVASDAMITEIDERAYIAFTYPNLGLIKSFYIIDERPDFLRESDFIDSKLASRHDFCPQNITYDPNNARMVEIFNYCPGKDQSILRYKFPPVIFNGKLQFFLVTRLPINFAYSNIKLCSTGNEFVIWSALSGHNTLQSANIYQDRNYFDFGTDDFQLGTLTGFNCVPRAKMFSVTSRDENNNVLLSVWWGNNQYRANHKLYKTVRTGLNSYKSIRSYDLLGQVIHVLSNGDGTNNFMLTWSLGPVIRVRFLEGLTAQTVRMHLKFLNSIIGSQEIGKDVAIIAPRTDLTMKITSKLTGPVPEIIPIEDYLSIKGTITHAYITGTHEVSLLPRVHTVGVYKPDFFDYNTFSRIESYEDILVGVHTSNKNSSVFTIFHNVSEFVGTYTPAHGVRSYAFARANTDNHTILLAYSTAEVANNSLQFIVLNGSTRIAVGHSDDGQVVDFSKVQVIPLAVSTDSWLVMGNNADTGILSIFRVDFVAGGQVKCQLQQTTSKVYWFSATAPKALNDIFLMYVALPWRQQLLGMVIQRNQTDSQFVSRPWNLPQPSRSKIIAELEMRESVDVFPQMFVIDSVECRNDNATYLYCLANYDAPLIYEYLIDGADTSSQSENFYYKLPGYFSMYLHGSSDYFIQMTENGDFHHTKYVVYKRISKGGQPDTYYSQDGDAPRSFCMTNSQNGTNMFMFLTGSPEAPLFFLRVDQMAIYAPQGTNLSLAHLEIEGLPGATHLDINVTDIFYNEDDGGDSKKITYWPFLLILGFLIMVALVYVIYNNRNSGEEQKASALTEGTDADKYVSLKP